MTLSESYISNITSQISDIPDPEVPVITIADLGILREVKEENGKSN